MFIVFPILIWGSVLTHILFRTLGLCKISGKVRILLASAFYIAGLGYIPARALLHFNVNSDAAAMLVSVFAAFFGFTAILWALLIPIEAMALLARLVKRIRVWSIPARDGRMIAAGWWGLGALLMVVGFVSANAPPLVTHMEITAPVAQAKRLVALSDIHLGANASPELWKTTLELAREQQPDALLIVGDLVDDSSRHTERLVAMVRDHFPIEPVYVVSGNHERYTGLDYFGALCARHDFTWLRQEVAALDPGLMLGGIDDARGVEAIPYAAQVRSLTQGPLLMLIHRPEVAHLFKDRSDTLIISGHTHAGQLPPMVFIVALGNGGFSSGYYPVGDAHLYVSSGAGLWGPPVRLLAPAEIIVLDILPGASFEIGAPTVAIP